MKKLCLTLSILVSASTYASCDYIVNSNHYRLNRIDSVQSKIENIMSSKGYTRSFDDHGAAIAINLDVDLRSLDVKENVITRAVDMFEYNTDPKFFMSANRSSSVKVIDKDGYILMDDATPEIADDDFAGFREFSNEQVEKAFLEGTSLLNNLSDCR